jgi:MYXO-CTERM domain-containing protein
MISSLVESSSGSTPRTRRWGIGLALLALLYVAAVVAFIIVY